MTAKKSDKFTAGSEAKDVTPKGSKVKQIKLPPEMVKKANGAKK